MCDIINISKNHFEKNMVVSLGIGVCARVCGLLDVNHAGVRLVGWNYEIVFKKRFLWKSKNLIGIISDWQFGHIVKRDDSLQGDLFVKADFII